MIESVISTMSSKIDSLKKAILQDIEDIKTAKHDELLKRNDEKQIFIDEITSLKAELNKELIKKLEAGVDVNIYRGKVDALEKNINQLNELNQKLASIVLPIQNMYKELVGEISSINGGRAFDIKA